MDGLLEQAKSRLWEIVNETSELRRNGEIPILEIAMYDYGNDGIRNKNFIRKQLDFYRLGHGVKKIIWSSHEWWK